MPAGFSSAVPGAITGIAVDVGILIEVLPRINKAFGIDPEQIDDLDEQIKQQIFICSGTVSSHIIGMVVTK